jgi:hypothetical protein
MTKDVFLRNIDSEINVTLSKMAISERKIEMLKKQLIEFSEHRHIRLKQLKILHKCDKLNKKIIDSIVNAVADKKDIDFNVNTSNGSFVIVINDSQWAEVKKLDIDYIIKNGILDYLSKMDKRFVVYKKLIIVKKEDK